MSARQAFATSEIVCLFPTRILHFKSSQSAATPRKDWPTPLVFIDGVIYPFSLAETGCRKSSPRATISLPVRESPRVAEPYHCRFLRDGWLPLESRGALHFSRGLLGEAGHPWGQAIGHCFEFRRRQGPFRFRNLAQTFQCGPQEIAVSALRINRVNGMCKLRRMRHDV